MIKFLEILRLIAFLSRKSYNTSMSLVSISDVHIRKNHDKGSQLVDLFIRQNDTVNAEIVCFLGDIFDFMVGSKKAWFKTYSQFFDGLKLLCDQGKKIYYIQGNHDFHIGGIFDEFLKRNNYPSDQIIYSQKPLLIKVDGENVLIGHGDDIELNNPGYEKWKSIYTSQWFKFINEKIFPAWFITFIGEKASSNSKYRNSKSFEYQQTKETFRNDLVMYNNQKAKIVLMGHSHILDEYKVKKENGDSFLYLNNGFPLKDRKYIQVKQNQALLKDLV
jgi:UDP-2,3-diacylglucosamine hydrolase